MGVILAMRRAGTRAEVAEEVVARRHDGSARCRGSDAEIVGRGTDVEESSSDPVAIGQLLQLADTSCPTGGFATSGGLESAVASGVVTDGWSLAARLSSYVEQGFWGREGNFVLLAWWASARKSEMAMERLVRLRTASLGSVRMREVDALRGRALTRVVTGMCGSDPLMDRSSRSYPTAFGVAAERLGVPADVAGQVYVCAHLLALGSAAVRLGVVTATEAQRIVWHCAVEARRFAPRSLGHANQSLGGCDFEWEIDTMNHPRLPERLFEL